MSKSTDSKELVSELREHWDSGPAHAAADRIEALEAEVERLRAAMSKVLAECRVGAPGPHWRWHDEYYEAFDQARAALEGNDGE